jgi:hypothetical protein
MEAPVEYEWTTLGSVNSDKAFNAIKAIQQIVEAILMWTDILVPLRPGPMPTAESKIHRLNIGCALCAPMISARVGTNCRPSG